MRLRFMAFLFCLISSVANAEERIKIDKPVICQSSMSLVTELKTKFGEELIISGKHAFLEDVYTAIFLNNKTGSYTVIELNGEVACVISLGTDFKFRLPTTSTL